MVGEDFSLLPQWRDKAVNLAAMLGAFAQGIDIRIIDGAHLVVDDNGASDGKTGTKADLGIETIPAAITSMSQASVEPSLNARPVTQSSPSTAAVLFSRWTVTPNFCSA